MPLIMFVSSSFNTYVNLSKKKKGGINCVRLSFGTRRQTRVDNETRTGMQIHKYVNKM